jgi:hypothetical protein
MEMIMKTALAALLALSTLAAVVAPAAAGFGPKDLPTLETSPGFGPRDLPTQETSPGFGPKDLPEQPGPARSIWLEDNK